MINRKKFKDATATNDRSNDQLEEIGANQRIYLDIAEAGVRIVIEVSWDSWINLNPIVMALADNIFPKGMEQV